MRGFESEFGHAAEIYDLLKSRLDAQFEGLREGRIENIVSTDGYTDLVRTMDENGKRVQVLIQHWQRVEGTLPRPAREDVRDLLLALHDRAQSLLAVARRNEDRLRELREAHQTALQEIEGGKRYLRSVRKDGDNRPRFFDSRC